MAIPGQNQIFTRKPQNPLELFLVFAVDFVTDFSENTFFPKTIENRGRVPRFILVANVGWHFVSNIHPRDGTMSIDTRRMYNVKAKKGDRVDEKNSKRCRTAFDLRSIYT